MIAPLFNRRNLCFFDVERHEIRSDSGFEKRVALDTWQNSLAMSRRIWFLWICKNTAFLGAVARLKIVFLHILCPFWTMGSSSLKKSESCVCREHENFKATIIRTVRSNIHTYPIKLSIVNGFEEVHHLRMPAQKWPLLGKKELLFHDFEERNYQITSE